MGGRQCLITGRPTKQSRMPLKKRSPNEVQHLLPKKRPRKAPHNLLKCSQNNESVGKSHSAK